MAKDQEHAPLPAPGIAGGGESLPAGDRRRALWSLAWVLTAVGGSSAWGQFATDVNGATASVKASGAAPSTPPGPVLDDVVVTARKIVENAQRVPVSVFAVNGQELIDSQVTTFADLTSVVPGVTLRQASVAPSALQIQLRGQLQNDTVATEDPSIGTYVDGVYWARAYGMNADLLDIKDIQLLNGPQGTLFGRNTTGGAILIQTEDPKLDALSGTASATAASFREKDASLILNAPIIPGVLGIRAALQTDNRDGYLHDTADGRPLDSEKTWIGRFKILYRVDDRLQTLLSAEFYNRKDNANPFRVSYAAQPILASFATRNPIIGSALNAEAAIENGAFVGGAPDVVAGSQFLQRYIAGAQGDAVAMNQDWPIQSVTRTVVSTTSYDLGWGALKFIGAYRGVLDDTDDDLDGSPIVGISANFHRDLAQWSGELQLTGKALGGRLDLASGLFYFAEHGIDQSTSVSVPALNPTVTVDDGAIKNRSDGLYAQGTYRLTDTLGITAGLRYSSDDKGLTTRNRTLAEAGTFGPDFPSATQFCNVVPITPAAFGAVGDTCALYQSKTFSAVSYTLGADYRFTDELMAYLKTSKGSRSGGQNLRGGFYTIGGVSTPTLAPYDPEFIKDLELGLKSQFWDNRARANLAVYHSWNTDIQRTLIVVTDQTPDTVVVNAGKQQVSGAEGEFKLQALTFARDELIVGLNGSYTDPRYTRYVDPITGANLANSRFEGVPKWTTDLLLDYRHRFGSGTVGAHGDYAWRSRMALQPYNDAGDPFNQGLIGASTSPSLGFLNARASYTVLNESLELSLWCKNVTDKRIATTAVEFGAPLDTVFALYSPPRMLGATVTYKFGARTDQ